MSLQRGAATAKPLTKKPLPESGLKRWMRVLGPGLITGAADDDPSGISTYSIAGATAGLSMLWLALLTTPMMAVVQGMCARIGMVSGIGLSGAIRKHYPLPLAYVLAVMVIGANTLNIGADIAGMATSTHMLFGLPEMLWVVFFGFVLIAAQMYVSYRKFANILKYLTLSLFAYVITAFVVHPDWLNVLKHAVVPEFRLEGKWFVTVMGVLGTTITPYLFFWQASLMVEEEKELGRSTVAARRGASADEIEDTHLDVNTGMILSNLVMFFIIVTTATTLGAHGKHDIATAQDAAEALRPLAGNFAYLLFTVGMVGTGLLAIPVLAGSSAYIAAETFAFRSGMNEHPNRVPRFYAVIGAGILLGVAMNAIHVDAIKALYWSAVINGLAAVPLLVVITLLANKRELMGRWKNSALANVWAWLTVALMSLAAISMFVFWGQ